MSTFTLRGLRGDTTIDLTWTDGALSGDPEAVEMVQMLAAAAEGHIMWSPATVTQHHHLQEPAAASMLMRRVFSGQPETIHASGIEPVPEPEDGAVM